MKKSVLLLMLTVCIACACKKQDDSDKTRTQLIARTWVPDRVLYNGEEDSNPYYMAISWEFRYDGTYVFKDPDGGVEGTWEFLDNETKVILDKGASDERTWEILTLSSEEWRIKYTDAGDTFEITLRAV